MAITINVNGVNSGGGNNNQPPTPNTPPTTPPSPQPQPTQQPTNNQPSQPTPPPNPTPPNNPPTTPYQRPDFTPYGQSNVQGANTAMPTSERMVSDIRAEISRRGIIMVPGTQNFSTMLNTLHQNQRSSVMGQIDSQYDKKMSDIDNRKDALMYEIKGRLDLSRNSELAATNDPVRINEINRRYDRLMDREASRADRFFAGQYDAVEQEKNSQTAEAEQRLTDALQRLTDELSQGNKDSYLNNLRDKYKEQIWRRDNADTEEEVREASREAAKIQERMQRAMSGGNSLIASKFVGSATSMLAIAGNAAVQLDRNAIQRNFVGFDMASSVLNGNAFAAIRQKNTLDEQRNQIGWTAGGALAGAALGAGVGMGFLGVGAVPGAIIGGIAGLLGGVGGNAIAHYQNRGMFIEDERTRVADLWRQEEQRMMQFNDLAMLNRRFSSNSSNIAEVRRQFIESSGERPFIKPDTKSETGNNSGGILSTIGNGIDFITNKVKDLLGLQNSYVPSSEIKKRISKYEGAAMYMETIDPLSGKRVAKNASFDTEAKGFTNALPKHIRDKVLSNRELSDNFFSYSYNVGSGNFRKRVVPALEKYYRGEGTVDEITSSMQASGDKKLRGLSARRKEEREGVRHALSGEHSSNNRMSSSSNRVGANEPSYDDIWRRSDNHLDLYDLGYTSPEFAQQAARRIKQRGFVDRDSIENALYGDALERVFSMSSGVLGELSKYDRFGKNNANQDFTNLAYTLDRLETTGMRNGAWARSDEFAGYMTQLQQGQRSTFLTVDNARAGRQIATGQKIFGDKFGAEAMQGIQAVNNQVQNPGGGFQQTLLYDVIQELFPDTRGRIDLIEQAQYDPSKQNKIQQAMAKRVESIYGGVDTAAGYLAMQSVYGIQNPNVLKPIAKQLTEGGLESEKLDTKHNAKSEAQVLNNGYTPETTQKINAMADQQMKSLLYYQEEIAEVVRNILDKIETSVSEKLQEAVDNLKQ